MKKEIIFRISALAAAVLFMTCGVMGCGKKDKEEQAEVPVSAAESYAPNSVLALTPDGQMFPELDVVLPTTEPAPQYLREGSKHTAVRLLQERLMQLGFMDNDEPTNYYGPSTVAAVKKYQRQMQQPQDGIVGPETMRNIMSDSAPHYMVQNGDDGDDIIMIQQRLYQLGYLASSDQIGGHFGDKTEEAVKKFQEINKITVDGKVGLASINLLYSEDVKANLIVFGEQSEVVLAAQRRLFDLGYMTSQPDGTYGADTSLALKTFQRKNSLIADGYLGPETRDVLMSSMAKHNGLGLGDENEMVKKVQNLLIKWNYLASGRNTGYYGEVTQLAVKNFQQKNGLSADGMVGAQTMAKLTSDDVKKGTNPVSTARTNTGGSTSGGGSSSGGSSSGGGGSSSGGSTSGGGGGSTSSGGSSVSVPNTDAAGVSGNVSALLSVARSKLGCPYVWGAKGANSFDCSGFVYWCLNQVGVSQSYITSSGWQSVGKYQRISNYSDLRAGDIIVVSGHVGIISTGGYLIDASSSNGCVIERPLGSWWANHFIVGWRIF